jgi:hypothetical protein
MKKKKQQKIEKINKDIKKYLEKNKDIKEAMKNFRIAYDQYLMALTPEIKIDFTNSTTYKSFTIS